MIADQDLVMLALALGILTFNIGATLMIFPLPPRWKAYGRRLIYDSIITIFAANTVSAMPLLMDYIQSIGAEAIGMPSSADFENISNQLITLQQQLFKLVGVVSSINSPKAELLARSLGQTSTLLNSSLLTWTALETISKWLPQVWLYGWIIGIVFWSIPGRIGRQLGGMLAALSLTATIVLPYAPMTALWLEQNFESNTSQSINELITEISNDPNSVDSALDKLPQVMQAVYASTTVAFLLSPYLYVSMTFLLARGVATILGGRGMRGLQGMISRWNP